MRSLLFDNQLQPVAVSSKFTLETNIASSRNINSVTQSSAEDERTRSTQMTAADLSRPMCWVLTADCWLSHSVYIQRPQWHINWLARVMGGDWNTCTAVLIADVADDETRPPTGYSLVAVTVAVAYMYLYMTCTDTCTPLRQYIVLIVRLLWWIIADCRTRSPVSKPFLAFEESILDCCYTAE